jgi:hypothetical protein
MPAFKQAMVRAGAVIHNDQVAADFDEVARTLPLE